MIIEFIGCSGVGKTTLARRFQRCSPNGDSVLLATDLVMERPGRRWIRNPTAINMVADVTVLPWFLGTLGKNQDFAKYAADRLRRHAPSAFVKFNYMRNIVRRVGLHELARRAGESTMVLADEGTVLTAYYLFVYSDGPFDQVDLEHFARLVPLPDWIVYMKAPVEVLVDRAIRRPDRRRELAMDDRKVVEHWIERALEIFDGLAVTEPIRDRIVTVDNADSSPDHQRMLVSQIAAVINERTLADKGGNSPGLRPVRILRSHDILKTIKALVEELNDQGIRYCHWKSNWALAETMRGKTDIDLLVHRQDVRRFREILKQRGFLPSVMTGVPPFPSIEHYHAFDRVSGTIVHVHAYYQVITGESLVKNYQLPVRDMLLGKTRREGIVKVPLMGAELIIFVLRVLLKHTTIIELTLLARQWSALRREVAWLMTDAALAEATELLRIWLPQIDDKLFRQAFEALKRPASLWRRMALAYRVRGRLRSFTRRSGLRARWVETKRFAGLVKHRLAGSSKKLSPGGGGAVIAFVGSEATGKSTILSEIEHWLGKHYTLRRVHAGKPPSTLLTLIPHRFLPALRRLFPNHRSTQVQLRSARAAELTEQPVPLSFALRAVMLAFERKVLLTRTFAWSEHGTIVLSDRYPSMSVGAPDSPQLIHRPAPSARLSLRRWLAELEARLYREVPIPDLVIHLTAPLDVTLARNEARDKREPEDYVRFRHSLSSNLYFDGAVVHHFDTDQPLELSVLEIKQAIWDVLGRRDPTGQSRPTGG